MRGHTRISIDMYGNMRVSINMCAVICALVLNVNGHIRVGIGLCAEVSKKVPIYLSDAVLGLKT